MWHAFATKFRMIAQGLYKRGSTPNAKRKIATPSMMGCATTVVRCCSAEQVHDADGDSYEQRCNMWAENDIKYRNNSKAAQARGQRCDEHPINRQNDRECWTRWHPRCAGTTGSIPMIQL
eukprot:SAG31_NODE_31767_length_364_cov_0.969811_1_plen_119_part_01